MNIHEKAGLSTVNDQGTYEVAAISLSDLFANTNQTIKLVKIDIEVCSDTLSTIRLD